MSLKLNQTQAHPNRLISTTMFYVGMRMKKKKTLFRSLHKHVYQTICINVSDKTNEIKIKNRRLIRMIYMVRKSFYAMAIKKKKNRDVP